MSHILVCGTRLLMNYPRDKITSALIGKFPAILEKLPSATEIVGPYASDAARYLLREFHALDYPCRYLLSSPDMESIQGFVAPVESLPKSFDNVHPMTALTAPKYRLREEEAMLENYWERAQAVVLLLAKNRASALIARCDKRKKQFNVPVFQINC